jgi:hypothetical protein
MGHVSCAVALRPMRGWVPADAVVQLLHTILFGEAPDSSRFAIY